MMPYSSENPWRVESDRAGVTLIETLVAIAVIGLLVLTVLAAIPRAREAARKAQCASNLRQIGIAIHAYAASINRFPNAINGGGYSVHTMLLPYLEKAPIYQSINFSHNAVASTMRPGVNQTASVTSIDTFLCPSDHGSETHVGFWTNYAGNRGTGVQKSGYDGAFAFELTGSIGFADFKDGTASTIAMSEWLLGTEGSDGSDPSRTVYEVGPLGRGQDFDLFVGRCSAVDPRAAPINGSMKGRFWIRGDFPSTLYNHVMMPNQFSCSPDGLIQQGAWTAGSHHHAGVNAVFVDGHVEFVRQGVSPGTWRSLSTRSGGENISK